MFSLWVFSDNRQTGKMYSLPFMTNWSGLIDVSHDVLGEIEPTVISIIAEEGKWFITPPNGYKFDKSDAETMMLQDEVIIKLVAPSNSLTIIPAAYKREKTVMAKYVTGGRQITIGKGEGNVICYPKALVSTNHCTIVGNGREWQLSDHSVNGTWINGRRTVNRTVVLRPGDSIFIAPFLRMVLLDNFFAINTNEQFKISPVCQPYVHPEGYSLRAPEDISVTREYHRAPRIMQQPNDEEITIDPPLEKDRNKQTPTWLAIGPSMTMVLPMLVSTLVMQRSMGASLVMIGTSSALSVMWGMLNRKYAEKDKRLTEENRQKICRQYFAEMEEQLIAETDREKKRLNQHYLSVNECIQLPAIGDHRMWERLPQHEDFLAIRLGIGERMLPFSINIQKVRINLVDDPLRHEPQRLKDIYQMMKNAPVVINTREHPIIGVLGNKSSPWMMQSMVAQIAASHSYRDVRIIILYDEKNKDQWRFAHRLPHVFAEDDRTLRMAVSGDNARQEVLSYFDNILKVRSDMLGNEENGGKEEGDIPMQLPWYMVFVTDPTLIEDQPVLRYLSNPHLGFTMVMQAPEMELLPKECDLIIEARSELGTVFHSDGTMTGVNFETVGLSQLDNFAKSLAPYRIKEMTGNTAIPSLVTFLESYGVRKVEELDVFRNWSDNHAWQNLKTILGLKAGSTPFVLDISDKNHGPHGLIAGTTGAGKSVLLQSFILSLSLNYNPSEIQFVLIDYKGGGTSESFRELPHVAGIIDSSEGARTIYRALASIRGEIKRREAIFKEVGVNNIDDYMKLFNADPTEETLSHLVIIVDEFAELKKEEPEFMHELVSAARVGRSLGMHLVLATQKPGNSVSDEIDANTRFRICLRVASRGDSTEMIKHPDAAYLKGMGRCFVRVGSDEVFEQVQTSWSGSSYNPDALRPEEEPRILNDAGQPIKFRKRKKAEDNKQQTTELDVVLEYIRQCCDKYKYSWARQMWLKEMDKIMLLSDICKRFERKMWDGEKWPENNVEEFRVLYGMADDINTQRRIPAEVDFLQARNLMIAGLPGSGKTTALQTIAAALATQYAPDEVNIYAFSLTSHMLQCLSLLPHVGEIVYEEDTDEQIRLMNMLYAEGERRKKLFRELATDNFVQFNRSAINSAQFKKIPAIVVLIDRMQQLRDWDDGKRDQALQKFYDMLRSGASQGIFFIMTAFNRSELPMKYHPFIRAVTLQQNERADYADALGARVGSDWGGIREYPGRGIMAVEDKEAKETFIYEMQVSAYATVASDKERADAILALGKQMRAKWQGDMPVGITRIPQKPTLEMMLATEAARNALKEKFMLPLGYVKDQGTVLSIDLKTFYSALFIGPKKAGKTTLMQCMALVMRDKGYEVNIIGNEALMEWANKNGVNGYTYASAQWMEKFQSIRNVIGERSKMLTDAKNISNEKKNEVADNFKPIVLMIDEIDKFIALNEKEQGMLTNLGFFVQDNEKIASYKIFTYATVSRKGYSSARMQQPLMTMLGVQRAIMMQGVTYEADPYGVSSRSASFKRAGELPRGEGLLVTDDGITRLVFPQIEIQEDDADSLEERG